MTSEDSARLLPIAAVAVTLLVWSSAFVGIRYADRQLYGFVLRQSWLFALLGFLPGLMMALGLYGLIEQATRLPVFMTAPRAAGVLLLSLLMCTCAGALTLRKLSTADPADLF